MRIFGALLLILVYPLSSNALTARWLGVAGLSVTDGATTLIFDPVFTKPTLKNWIFGSAFRANPERVGAGLGAAAIDKANAVMVSHTHFDHAVDAALVSRLTGATVYGSESLSRVVQKNDFPVRFEPVKDRQQITVGKFKITFIQREHSAILQGLDWKFLEGPVPADFDFKFYQYHVGETWAYFVEHPDGSILIDQGSHFFEPNAVYAGKADAYFVGVANKTSLEDLVANNINRICAPLVVPLHFDVFFLQGDWIESRRLPGSELEKVSERIGKNESCHPHFFIPTRNGPIPIR
ncbi:MAG: MBL fold metallo-hydrolase [Bdellovibrionales bacterium]|nr:MBL fold metallo-hydrolase [Bdellovibrionales bacterium]